MATSLMSTRPRFSSEGVDWEVQECAYEYTIETLEQFGNIVSSEQTTELHKTLGCFVYTIAKPESKRRQAFPLPCGAGKTTAVRGIIRAIHELGRGYKIVVCAEKVEALCELLRDLRDLDGVPRGKISLLHSYEHDPAFDFESPKDRTASEPADSDDLSDLRQFVLLSHSKLHQGYNKMPYDLLIYDESLVLGQASTIGFEELCGEIAKFIGRVEAMEHLATPDQKKLCEWMKDAQMQLRDASDNNLLTWSPLPIGIKEARAADKPIHGADDTLRVFMGWVNDQQEVRLIKEQSQGGSVITIQQTIPDHLNSLAILDASYNIRRLMTYDKTISDVRMFSDIKDHSDVTIHLAKAKAGRKSVFKELQNGGDDKLFHEVAELSAKKVRAGHNVLVFTFKDNGAWKPVSRLRELTTQYLDGVPPDMVSTGGSLNFLTWGYETALNRYSHCDVVIFAGLLTLPHSAVAGRICAHARDINQDMTPEELNEVVQSEKVHSLYQALSRGSCRVMKNGKARKMDAYVFSHDYLAIREALKTAMSGVQFRNYTSKHLKTKASKRELAKEAILIHLSSTEKDKESARELYALVPEISQDTMRAGLNELLDDVLAFEWKKQDRSIVRIGVEE